MSAADQGFRQPAEWAPHDAVWTAWPYLAAEWADGLAAPRAELAAMCRAIADVDPATGAARGERVELLVRPADEADARALLGATPVRCHHLAYGDVWLRDTGPIFVSRPGEVAAARFRWDGWGGKYLLPGDPEVSAAVARRAGVRDFSCDLVLEGGAVEPDGAGTLLTTRQCLLDGVRNPGVDAAGLERVLAAGLGAERVIWLDRGLKNDHTDGHVDTLARFVAPGVVVCMEPAAGDPNRDALAAILADLRDARDARGERLEVMTVPSPGAVVDGRGALLPASYLNFYIGNRTVVVPVYGAGADDAAVAALATLFPGRRTVGVMARAILVGGGAFHCCTQQQPARAGM
jgi:agmatine deiminase